MAPPPPTETVREAYENAAARSAAAVSAIRGFHASAQTAGETSFDISVFDPKPTGSVVSKGGSKTRPSLPQTPAARMGRDVKQLASTINGYEGVLAAAEKGGDPPTSFQTDQYNTAVNAWGDIVEILNTPTTAGDKPSESNPSGGAGGPDADTAKTIKTLNDAIVGQSGSASAIAGAGQALSPGSLGNLDPVTSPAQQAIQIRNAIQCWLLYNMEVLAEYNEKNVSIDSKKSINEPGFQSTHLQPSTHNQRIILTSKRTSGFALTGKLQARKGTESFKTIQTHEYAQLMPSLRIFKVRNDVTTGKKKTIEMEFNNHTSLDGIARELTTHRPDGKPYSIFNKGSEVGVKSFEWTFLGADSFMATRDITATLKLTAQSFGPLVQIRESIPNSPTIDSETKAEPYRYVDLLVQPDCEADYAPECYEVRIDVGYAPIGDTGTAAVRQGVKDSVQCQKDMLYLVLTDHAFNINEDGSIDLTINFRGRLETLMKGRKMNVLLPYGGSLQNKIKLDIETIGPRTAADAEKELSDLRKKSKKQPTDKEKIKKYEQALKDLNVQYKQIIHSHILDMLQSAGKIRRYPIPDVEFNMFKNYQARLSQNQSLPQTLTLTALEASIGSATKIREEDIPPASTSQDALRKAMDKQDNNYLLRLNTAPRKNIRFFFLGDLLAIVLQSVTGDNTVMGSINNKPWLAAFLSGQSAATVTATNTSSIVQKLFERFRIILGNIDLDYARTSNYGAGKKINLAHIPISLDAYTAFFANNVLAKERTNYPFFSFVDDVLNDLVMDPLSSRCFDGLFDIKFRPQVQSLVVPKEIDNKWYQEETSATTDRSGAQQTVFERYKTLNLNEVPIGEPLFDYCASSENVENLFEYLVISSEVTDLDVLQGDEEEDRKRGILHLHFGNAYGMMKKVSFQKTDMEYLPEMRYATEGNILFNQLANVYDVNIEMIGNNLFKPGQHVYINAAAIGAGAPWDRSAAGKNRSWANLMGLGGYHFITEVAHSISVDGFNTNLKARWVASGMRDGIKEDPVDADYDNLGVPILP